MQISKVAVVGAGTMGAGIAQVAAQEGFEAILLDVSEPIVRQGIERIDKNLSRSVERGDWLPTGKNRSSKESMRPRKWKNLEALDWWWKRSLGSRGKERRFQKVGRCLPPGNDLCNQYLDSLRHPPGGRRFPA